jgi:hypothetical protein
LRELLVKTGRRRLLVLLRCENKHERMHAAANDSGNACAHPKASE